VRVTTAFNRVLKLPGATVSSVEFADEGGIVGIRNRRSRLRCPCGFSTSACYDRSIRRWRHVDLGNQKLFLEGEIRRLFCPCCETVRTEQVPWARPRARHTRDFESVVTWLCQRADKTTVSKLLRCSWEAVDAIVTRVVAEHLDKRRLDNIYRIGVDEISYRRGHQYLTVIVDHDTGHVVWVGEGKGIDAFEAFLSALDDRKDHIEAVSMDFGTTFREVARRWIPNAAICFDPFHLIQMANRALHSVYKSSRGTSHVLISGAMWRRAQVALRSAFEKLTDRQHEALTLVTKYRRHVGRAWELKEDLRDLYRIVEPQQARLYLKRWITNALRSRIPAFQSLARQVKKNFEGIINAVEMQLANARVEGTNAHIRVIQRRSHGLANADALGSMIFLCRGGITVKLPTES
jgi:transposase